MKRRKQRSWSFVLIWVLIYILALVVGTVMASVYSYRTNDNLPNLAREDAAYYAREGEFSPQTGYYRVASYVFSEDGRLLDSSTQREHEERFVKHALKQLPHTLSEGSTYTMAFDLRMNNWVAIIIGFPIELPDGGSAVYFMVKGLYTLQTILIVLFLALTIFLVLSCLYSVLVMRNDRRLENLRREYVANVSHDLKSPIASIRALSESLYDGVITDPEKQKKCLGIILRESDRLEHTVLNMLELSKTQSMQTSFEKREVEARELFQPITESFSARCEENGIRFSAPENLDTLPLLYTNSERVTVLTNVLLDNAAKFVSPGGNIRLEISAAHKKVVVCVRDDGIGIRKEEQKRIFERFYTGDHARNTKGSGLGLAIADEIVHGLDEEIWVDSVPGKGASFCFTLSTK